VPKEAGLVEDGPERDVDERPVRERLEPRRWRLVARGREQRPDRLDGCSGGNTVALEARRAEIDVRAAVEAAERLRLEAHARPERGGLRGGGGEARDRDRPPERVTRRRDAGRGRGDGRREVRRVVHDEVRTPVGEDADERVELRGRLDHPEASRERGHAAVGDREGAEQRTVRRDTSLELVPGDARGKQVEAGGVDPARERRRRRKRHRVAVVRERPRERHEREEVPVGADAAEQDTERRPSGGRGMLVGGTRDGDARTLRGPARPSRRDVLRYIAICQRHKGETT
jgi:hypothetical protein